MTTAELSAAFVQGSRELLQGVVTQQDAYQASVAPIVPLIGLNEVEQFASEVGRGQMVQRGALLYALLAIALFDESEVAEVLLETAHKLAVFASHAPLRARREDDALLDKLCEKTKVTPALTHIYMTGDVGRALQAAELVLYGTDQNLRN